LSEKERKGIFFLEANDVYFKPHVNPKGRSIVTQLVSRTDEGWTKFTDVPLGDKAGYFVIAAPST
jgi:hypothetical protein